MIAVLGAFDGYHLGHQKLLRTAAELALKTGAQAEWGVVTFSPHPGTVVGGRNIPVLFTDRERDFLGRLFQIPATLKISFSRALAELSPTDFLDYLEDILPLSGIVVGADFRFGRNREGDRRFIEEEARRRGWLFEAVEPLTVNGEKVASSSIRSHVAHGAMNSAARLLGYPFFLAGPVVKGDGRGTALGFPTANIAYPPEKVLPRRGVYAASVYTSAGWRAGALNVGVNPTFNEDGKELRAETYIIEFDGTLYGEEIVVFIEEFLREEKKFRSPELLVSCMKDDAERAARHFASSEPGKEKFFRNAGELLGEVFRLSVP